MAHHQEQDQRSLLLHSAAINMMQQDEQYIQKALSILKRWLQKQDTNSAPLLREWQRILTERDWELALSTSERGNQLRQASPVSCILSNELRLEIIKAASKYHNPQLVTPPL